MNGFLYITIPIANLRVTMGTKKLCKDCKFCNLNFADPHCEAPQNNEGDFIFGRYRPRLVFCDSQRVGDFITSIIQKACGKSGRWFQKKD